MTESSFGSAASPSPSEKAVSSVGIGFGPTDDAIDTVSPNPATSSSSLSDVVSGLQRSAVRGAVC